MSIFAERCRRLQDLMALTGFDAVIAGASADLRYLSGYAAHQSERLTAFAVPRKGEPFMVLPGFEAPRLGDKPWFRVLAWNETDDPIGITMSALGAPARARIAVADRTWSAFLVGLQSAGPTAHWSSATPLLRELRMRKDAAEVAAMRTAGAAVDAVFEEALGWNWLGRTEQQVAEDIGAAMRARGCESVDFAIVGSGPNSASPHHSATTRAIQVGDAVVLDFGGPFEGGYFADITRTIFVGETTAEMRRVYAVVQQAQEAGVRAVRPRMPCQSVDAAARKVIDDAGLGREFNHRTGHGIGLDGHEEPYMVKGNDLALEPGMAFSVEPGVYFAGRFGVRIEDIVVCTANGVERLNNADRELHVVK